MSTYELQIKGIDSDAALAGLRWDLFVRREIVDVHLTGAPDVVAVVHDGKTPDVAGWLEVLREAGYEAAPLTHRDELAA